MSSQWCSGGEKIFGNNDGLSCRNPSRGPAYIQPGRATSVVTNQAAREDKENYCGERLWIFP